MHRGQAFDLDQLERRLEPGEVGDGQRAAELEVVQVAAPPRPVPVEARRRRVARHRQGALVGGDEGEAGRQHQPLLRRADRDVDAERVHRERRRGERGDDVDDEQGRMSGRVDRPAQRRQVRGGAAGGVGVDDEHRGDAMRGVVAQRRLDRRRIDRHPFDIGRAQRLAAERGHLLGPAVGEVAGARNQDRGAGGDQVGDHRLPAAVAVGGVEEDLGALGLQQRLHPRFAGGDQGRDARIGEVGRLPHHRGEHLVGHPRRPGRVQQAQAGNAGAGSHAGAMVAAPLAARRRHSRRPDREHVGGDPFVVARQAQQLHVAARPADQLHAHRQAGGVEADRHADARQAGEGGGRHHLHPAVVGVHRPAGDLLRPAPLDRERPDLRRRQGEEVEAVEQLHHLLIEGAAIDARLHHLRGAELGAVVVLPQRLGLDPGAVRRLRQMRRDPAVDDPPAPLEPGVPEPLGREAERGRLDAAALALEAGEAGGADVEDAVFHRQVAVEVAEPADAQRRRALVDARLQPRGERRLGGERERHARVVAGLHVEHQGEVADVPRHRPFGAEVRDPDVRRRPVRHPALARAKAEHVVPGRRGCAGSPSSRCRRPPAASGWRARPRRRRCCRRPSGSDRRRCGWRRTPR